MSFSQRIGLEPATKPFQKDAMDGYLRNGLWNAFDLRVLPYFKREWVIGTDGIYSRTYPNTILFVTLWKDFFRWPLPTLPGWSQDALKTVHDWFYNEGSAPWNRVYDFTEFVANITVVLPELSKAFIDECNFVMEREFSAYRFIGNFIGPITNDAEITAIVDAASMDRSPLAPASKHIATALKLLSDREKPDYRNSMKESISAVEAVCKIMAPNTKTLGPALDAVTAKVKLHPKLQEGFKALYGYASDTHGIRHALKDDATPDAEDAKFMLVSCSAFVNYLAEKGSKNGLLPK